jgi:hypothetical protein
MPGLLLALHLNFDGPRVMILKFYFEVQVVLLELRCAVYTAVYLIVQIIHGVEANTCSAHLSSCFLLQAIPPEATA